MAKVYDVRLNPEDIQTAMCGPGCSDVYKAQCWEAAVENTMSTILASLPHYMREAIPFIVQTLPGCREDSRCERCGGSGRREDEKTWYSFQGTGVNEVGERMIGKVCFKCKGTGVETKMHPIFFRRRAIDTLRERDEAAARRWADRVRETEDNPYRPVLIDIADMILDGGFANINRLPH
jgi:hypothetical protein